MNTIIRWNPLREMAAMQNALDRIFEDTWRSARPIFAGNGLSLDVYEADNAYTVVTSLPGLTADQIQVSMHDGVLTISGELPQGTVPENARVLLQERAFGKFTRSITLPQTVDVEHIEAAFENGVLTLTLPKVPEVQPKLIPVRAGTTVHSNGS